MTEHDVRPPDANSNRSKTNLQCIGSFRASAENGECHTIEVWTHFGAVHDRDISRVAPSLLVLTTTDGHGVDRIGKGLYRFTERPDVVLSTDASNAP